MSFLKGLIEKRWGENYGLHETYVNPQFVRVLRTIGFDKVYRRAEGQYLYDSEENRYLDFLSGYGVFAIGRNHPRIKEVIREVLEADLPHLVQMDCSFLSGILAEKLISLTSDHLDTVFFTNSGTEAVEGGLKFARAATGREKILYLKGAFHGLTLGSLSANGNEEFRDGFGDLLPGTSIPMNDSAALEKELKTKQYAAFIFEPIQGKGVYLCGDSFLKDAERLCGKYGTKLVADEVQTGLGRTGRWFAYEHAGIEPDIVCIAKGLSGGFIPVGAILYRREIYDRVFTRMDRCVVHSNTFGKNNLAMACGLATIKILEEEKLLERSAILGEELIRGINEVGKKYEMFKEARGKGLMIGIEFKRPQSIKLRLGWQMIHTAPGLFGQMIVVPLLANHRILSQVAGHNDLVKLLPPLVISEQDIRDFLAAFDRVIAACHTFPGAAWEVGMTLAKRSLRRTSPKLY